MTRFRKRKLAKIKRRLQRHSSLLLAILLLFQVSYPTQVLALAGGPSQPEVQSFEPIGTSDMVDLFSGDFNYNLPLLDVEGYPINIAYHSGINTDQEASWVGLGWNINPGVINRNMRGLPDDFSGDVVKKEFNMKPNKTWGVAANVGVELFGKGLGVNLGGSYGFNFNNYTGPSVIKTFNVNISAGLGGAGKLNAGLGLTSSSDEGLTVQPSLGFSKSISTSEHSETTLGVSVGTSFNSRGGLKQLTISGSISNSVKGDYIKNGSNKASDTKQSVTSAEAKDYTQTSGSLGSQSAGGTFDFTQPTYTPKVDLPMKNFSMSGSFTLGGELWGVHGKVGLSGFYSAQQLATNTMNNPAYGYMYAENGQFNDNALMDFNREKDGTFTENTPALPLANFTFDTYRVSGQGIGGSYRPFRGDIGYIFDSQSYTTNDNDALTAEVGLGGYVHVGTNVTVIDVQSNSGKWKSDNAALYTLIHKSKGDGNDFENVYFKEANEKGVDSDPSFYNKVGRDNPVRFDVDFGKFDHRVKNGFVDQHGQTTPFSGPITRNSRDKKTQNISFLKRSDYNRFAVDSSYSTANPATNMLSANAQNYHIAEITTLGTDGSRYVYGIAAYNNKQKEITFSVGSTQITNHDNNTNLAGCGSTGLVSYAGNDNSLSNTRGIDNYFSNTETPAYAHSYLLTSVLTPDYIDADNIRGPSDGDYGGYTKFKYKRIQNYKWRVPVEANQATFTEGLKSDFTDDKGNIIYGEKDIYYLDSVITKNYIAVFHKSFRDDALGVMGENGGPDPTQKQMKLDSISLYSKRDKTTPLKRVHFEYTYDLCKGVVNQVNFPSQGKLTLKKIFFTYQNSNRARLSPYVFDYHETIPAENPNYNVKAYDRWGNYKPNNAVGIGVRTTPGEDMGSFIGVAPMPPSDYPYVDQDRTVEDVYAAVWTLKAINLPSGGSINVTYEADDYAYVQNRQAGEMFKVVDYQPTASGTDQSNSLNPVDISFGGGKLFFKLHNGNTNISEYLNGINLVYFRFLMNIRTSVGKPHLEYVSGYGEIDMSSPLNYGVSGGLGYITLKNVNLKDDNTGANVNPVVKAAINYGKLHLTRVVWDATGGSFSGTLSGSILSAMINSSFIKNIRDAVTGPNQTLYLNYLVGRSFVAGKSWIRLNNPDGHKLGGGLRVKKVEMIDNWTQMAGAANGVDANYGQEYTYNLDDGRSSGVAAYEPQLGGDENSFRQPIFVETKKLLVPDDESYVEEPFGESFFPGASVGYSQVTVKNIQRLNVSRHATGSAVHEFYTAKDFPTITKRTDVKFRRGKDGPGSLTSLLKINVKDYFAATQGFAIELNDMHGKPKGQKVYQENQNTPISSVEYKYKSDNYLNGSFKLRNDCQVVDQNGSISVKDIGMFFDMVGDFRESKTDTKSTTIELNVDVIPILGYPVPIPGIWPGFAKDKSRFRSATLTKVVQRFGILEETVAKDLGSVVSTKNLAYDSETGDLLLTQTTTNYNDKIYSFKYPAWWHYDGMGPAYQNLGFEQSLVNFTAGFANISSAYLFKEGDEVMCRKNIFSSSSFVAWVDDVQAGQIKLIKKDGSLVSGNYDIQIIRSGKRNNLTTDMAMITLLNDPLPSLSTNAYQNVLQASAVEFSNARKAHCDCITGNTILPSTVNGYVTGTKGTWRPIKSYTHLTKRSQSNTNNNTNIRKDGVLESYSPYYKLSSGSWQIDPSNWTSVSQVTEFNVFGQETENQDALLRYSSATFGYNQTMALSVAANSQFKEQGFDGFEDYRFNPCIDDHFKFSASDTTRLESHTGKYSMQVVSGSPKIMIKQINAVCNPPANCNIVLNKVQFTPTIFSVAASGGTAPYNFTWTVLSGGASNPQVTFGSPTNLQVTGTGPYSIQINVTDSNGCTQTVTLP